jgi:hypothetical protein
MSPTGTESRWRTVTGKKDARGQMRLEGEYGRSGGTGRIDAVVGPAGSRSGSLDSVEPGRADGRGDRPDDRDAAGWGAPAATGLCFGRRGCASPAPAHGTAWRQGGGGAGLCDGDFVRAGRDAVDPAAAESGNRAAMRNCHLGLAAQHHVAQKGASPGAGPGTRSRDDRMRKPSSARASG